MKRLVAERGVAIITALVVVTAATVAVSAMMWRQAIAVRKVENQASLGEARWLARSAVDWARLVLLQDARTSAVDHLGEIWALPLAETRVTDDLASTSSAQANSTEDAAFVSGRMRDAQSRLNLTGLATGEQIDEQRLITLGRLVEVVGGKSETAKAIALRMGSVPRPVTADRLLTELQSAGTIDATLADRLRPLVTILPVPTAVNLNTAPAEVLAACFQELPLDAARALVRSREQAWFAQVSDVAARLPGTSGKGTATNVAVASNFFEVDGRVRVGRVELDLVGLIEREQNGTTRVRSLAEK